MLDRSKRGNNRYKIILMVLFPFIWVCHRLSELSINKSWQWVSYGLKKYWECNRGREGGWGCLFLRLIISIKALYLNFNRSRFFVHLCRSSGKYFDHKSNNFLFISQVLNPLGPRKIVESALRTYLYIIWWTKKGPIK